MFSAERIQHLAPDVVLDIVAELAYWQSCYPNCHFFSHRLPFKAYIPSFKFGYDTFLLYHKQGLFEVLPDLQTRYRQLPERERIAWGDATLLIAATWKRMGGGTFT